MQLIISEFQDIGSFGEILLSTGGGLVNSLIRDDGKI